MNPNIFESLQKIIKCAFDDLFPYTLIVFVGQGLFEIEKNATKSTFSNQFFWKLSHKRILSLWIRIYLIRGYNSQNKLKKSCFRTLELFSRKQLVFAL